MTNARWTTKGQYCTDAGASGGQRYHESLQTESSSHTHTKEQQRCSRARCSFTAPPLPWRTGIDARSTDRGRRRGSSGGLLGRGKQSRSRRRRPYLLGSGGTAVQSGPLWLDEEGRVWLKRAALVCQRWGLGWSKWPALDTPPVKRAALDT